MSNYNSQLQSNNTDLQTILQTLQNKASGGGSGGSVETLKGVISPNMPFVDATVYFTNANLETESIRVEGTEVNIEVVRGSILVINYDAGHTDQSSSTGVTLIGGGNGFYSHTLQADNFKLACRL